MDNRTIQGNKLPWLNPSLILSYRINIRLGLAWVLIEEYPASDLITRSYYTSDILNFSYVSFIKGTNQGGNFSACSSVVFRAAFGLYNELLKLW